MCQVWVARARASQTAVRKNSAHLRVYLHTLLSERCFDFRLSAAASVRYGAHLGVPAARCGGFEVGLGRGASGGRSGWSVCTGSRGARAGSLRLAALVENRLGLGR